MPAKKATKKPTTAKKTPRKNAPRPKYGCPNPGRPLPLTKLVQKMLNDQPFAAFIKRLLCTIHSGSAEKKKAAIVCLDSYYAPENRELERLCLSSEVRARMIRGPGCTEENLRYYLIDVPAYVGANLRKRKRSRSTK